MAVTQEQIDELRMNADRVLKLDQMIKRHEAMIQQETERMAAFEKAKQSSGVRQAHFDLRFPLAGASRKELVLAVRNADASHRAFTNRAMAARTFMPSFVGAASLLLFQSALSFWMVGLVMLAMMGSTVLVDSQIRRSTRAAHLKLDQHVWLARRELNRRASVQDRRGPRSSKSRPKKTSRSSGGGNR